MALKKITGKDFKEAVDWLLKEKQGCVHQVLGTTNDGTELCFVVGWSKGTDYGDDDKKYGYFDEGYCISAKIGYQHRNNAMQTDYDWDFNMPYDLETGDVWDTSSYVPRDADWEREAADYNKEAEKIWAAYGDPDGKNFWDDDKAPLDLMESKKSSEAKKHTCSMQKKKESLAKKAESANSDYRFSIWSANHPENEKGFTRFICVTEPASSKGWYDVSKEYDDAYEEEMELRNGNVDYTYIAKKVMDKIVSGAIKSCDDPYDAIPNFSRRFKEYPFNLNAYKQDFLDGKYGSRSESKKPTCSMQKKKESLSAKKSEAYGDFNISDEDVKLTVNYVDVDSHGGSFSVDTPKDGQSYSLQEMKDMVKGMCEDCSGYADISRDGSDILIMVMAPETDENGEFANDYYAAYTVRCTVRIISTSLETFVDYLDKYNAE